MDAEPDHRTHHPRHDESVVGRGSQAGHQTHSGKYRGPPSGDVKPRPAVLHVARAGGNLAHVLRGWQ